MSQDTHDSDTWIPGCPDSPAHHPDTWIPGCPDSPFLVNIPVEGEVQYIWVSVATAFMLPLYDLTRTIGSDARQYA
jgi:Ni,Fe-hydrogenase III small subunit